MELEKLQNVPEKFRAGQREAPVHVVSKNDDFAILRLRFFFARVKIMVMHHALGGQIPDFEKSLNVPLVTMEGTQLHV